MTASRMASEFVRYSLISLPAFQGGKSKYVLVAYFQFFLPASEVYTTKINYAVAPAKANAAPLNTPNLYNAASELSCNNYAVALGAKYSDPCNSCDHSRCFGSLFVVFLTSHYFRLAQMNCIFQAVFLYGMGWGLRGSAIGF
jgi:hypothetical protein